MTPPDRPAPPPSTDVNVAPVLTAALRAAASGSQLEATLHDIVQAAVRHVGAGYGAMGVLTPDGDPLAGSGRLLLRLQLAAHDRLEAQVLRAIAETGVHGRTRTAVVERPVFEALFAATQGADLVVVSARGKTLLRQAVARPAAPRRVARGA